MPVELPAFWARAVDASASRHNTAREIPTFAVANLIYFSPNRIAASAMAGRRLRMNVENRTRRAKATRAGRRLFSENDYAGGARGMLRVSTASRSGVGSSAGA